MPVHLAKPLAKYKQLEDEKLNFSHSFDPYASAHSTSVSTVEVVDARALNIAGSLTDNTYTGTIQGGTPGDWTFKLKATMADGSIKIDMFEVEIQVARGDGGYGSV